MKEQKIKKQISEQVKTVKEKSWQGGVDYWIFEGNKLFWNHSYNRIKGCKRDLRRALTKKQIVNAIYEARYE